MLIADVKATAASGILKDYVATYDATVVKKLRNAGVVFIGKTNLDEFAMGSSTENSYFGPSKNPWDDRMVPGGSSGGSAAAVASNMCLAALGSDTGGSIRQPASLCGVTGIKPTYGRVSRYGLIAMASSLDQIGCFAKTAADAATVLNAISGNDPADATSVGTEEVILPELEVNDIKGLKIGLPKEYFTEGMDEGVRQKVLEAVEVLKTNGAEIVEINMPHTEYALAVYYIIMPSEVSSNLARLDGLRFGTREEGETLLETYKKTRGKLFGSEATRRIMLGTFALSAGYYDAYYKKAMQVRALIKKDYDEAFKKVDIIAGPTSPTVAWPIGEKFEDPLTMYLSDIYTISTNLAGLPGISIPCGFSKSLPVGLQLTAKSMDENNLIKTAMFYQSKTDWHTHFPSL